MKMFSTIITVAGNFVVEANILPTNEATLPIYL